MEKALLVLALVLMGASFAQATDLSGMSGSHLIVRENNLSAQRNMVAGKLEQALKNYRQGDSTKYIYDLDSRNATITFELMEINREKINRTVN